MRYQTAGVALAVCGLMIGSLSAPAGAKDCKQKSTLPRPIDLGVSGGNINSFVTVNHKVFCFSGTLGAMVQDGSANQFILSNNHVLARTNIASPGESIVQPGLAAIHCQQIQSDEVATFSNAVQLDFSGGTNTVDAAIAAVDSGDVNANILNIGPIASTVATAAVGLKVQKMGATSCLTKGRITAINASGQ